jgi:hypothetical protein
MSDDDDDDDDDELQDTNFYAEIDIVKWDMLISEYDIWRLLQNILERSDFSAHRSKYSLLPRMLVSHSND